MDIITLSPVEGNAGARPPTDPQFSPKAPKLGPNDPHGAKIETPNLVHGSFGDEKWVSVSASELEDPLPNIHKPQASTHSSIEVYGNKTPTAVTQPAGKPSESVALKIRRPLLARGTKVA